MSTVNYGIVVCPVDQAVNLSYVMASYNGDLLGSMQLNASLVVAGPPPAQEGPISNKMAGWWFDTVDMATYQAADPPAPPGGWPLRDPNDPGTVLLTEALAVTAWTSRYVNVTTGEDSEVLPAQNRAAVFAALGLEFWNPGD